MVQRTVLLLAALVLAVLVGSPDGATVAAQSDIDARLQRQLQDVIELARTEKVVPGISAAVATPDDLWTGVTGKSRLHPNLPVEPDTPFSIGSVTKTFVATVVLELREEGRLSLDDHLSEWESKVPNARTITVRQLLSHTSGVRDMWWDPRYKRLVEGRPGHVWTYPEVRAMMGPSRFRPGSRWEYSNSNYVLLGRIVERVTGHSVAQEIRTRLLDPLHLADTWFQGAETGPRAVAMGYLRRSGAWIPQGNGKGLRPTTSIATFFGSAGAMVSTARDLAVWARALYGGHVLQPASLRLMTSFNSHGYGLGARRGDIGGREAWGHGGSLDGFETSMWYLPVIDAAVVIIWNRRGLETDWTARKLARTVVDAFDPDVTPPTLGPPRITLRAGATVPTGYAPVLVTWPAAHDSQGPVVSYQARRLSDGGAWQSIRLSSPLSRSGPLSLSLDRTAVVAVRATDDRGNASAWVESRPLVPRFLDDSDPSVQADAGWRARTAPDALGGQVLASGVARSRLTFGFQALGVAIVTPRSRSLTRASVRIDDEPSSVVDLRAASRRPRQTLLSRRWAGDARHHALRVVVRSATHPRVEVDGFLVLEAAPVAPGVAPAAQAPAASSDSAMMPTARSTSSAVVTRGGMMRTH